MNMKSLILSWMATPPLMLILVHTRISPSSGFSFVLPQPYQSPYHNVKNKSPLSWPHCSQNELPRDSGLLVMSSNSKSEWSEFSANATSEQKCNTGYEYSRSLRPTKIPAPKQPQGNGRLVVGGSENYQQTGASSSSSQQNTQRWRMYLSAIKRTAVNFISRRRRGAGKDIDDRQPIHRVRSRKGLKSKVGTLILVRAGESEYAKNHTFTGWADPKLTQEGRQQMEHAGRLLLESGYEPDVIYTSRLNRAIDSTWIISQEISAPYLPVYKSWRLNGRHYGTLTGLCKKETSKRLGVDQVQAWRNELTARPPQAKLTDWYHPRNNRKYSDLLPDQMPSGESLLDCMDRTRPVWDLKIAKDLEMGNNVMVVGHANTLRSLAKFIDEIGDDEITKVSFPNGIPFVYKFDKGMNPIKLATDKEDSSFTQVHTSGKFLEKPDLLEKAMGIQKQWERQIPGVKSQEEEEPLLPNAATCMTTLEMGLLKLREEQQVWSRITAESTASKIETEFVGFEIDSNIGDRGTENVTVTSNRIDAKKEPVVVLVRHGRTSHNKLALFTGWEDPPLAKEGVEDARSAGKLLKKHGYEFDVVYSSWLYRAIQTAYLVLEEMDSLWLPLIQSWRLNERHYGALTGKSKKMASNIHGEEQLKKWRKGYTIRPPKVSSYSFHYPGNDVRRTKYVEDLRISFSETLFRSIVERKFTIHRKFPKSESLKDCMDRSIPFYTEKIVPEAVSKGKRVLIASHENAIRGILMHLCEIPEENMIDLHLPNGVPLVYSVRRKCITILDDGTGIDPVEKYDFGSAAKFLFTPCELLEEDFL